MRHNSRREIGSTPTLGSSSSRSLGDFSMAQARPSFCFMPPERFPASRLVKRARSVKASKPLEGFGSRLADNAAQIGVERQVLEHGQVFVEPEALGHVADGVMQRDAVLDRVVAADRKAAFGRRRAAPP